MNISGAGIMFLAGLVIIILGIISGDGHIITQGTIWLVGGVIVVNTA